MGVLANVQARVKELLQAPFRFADAPAADLKDLPEKLWCLEAKDGLLGDDLKRWFNNTSVGLMISLPEGDGQGMCLPELFLNKLRFTVECTENPMSNRLDFHALEMAEQAAVRLQGQELIPDYFINVVKVGATHVETEQKVKLLLGYVMLETAVPLIL